MAALDSVKNLKEGKTPTESNKVMVVQVEPLIKDSPDIGHYIKDF